MFFHSLNNTLGRPMVQVRFQRRRIGAVFGLQEDTLLFAMSAGMVFV